MKGSGKQKEIYEGKNVWTQRAWSGARQNLKYSQQEYRVT